MRRQVEYLHNDEIADSPSQPKAEHTTECIFGGRKDQEYILNINRDIIWNIFTKHKSR